MNEFEKRYKAFDNRKLLLIVNEANKYQPLAVDAAKAELSRRDVNAEEIQNANDELAHRDAQKVENKIVAIGDKAKALGAGLIDVLDPVQKESPSLDRRINLIVAFFSIIALHSMYSSASLFYYFFIGGAEWLTIVNFCFLAYPTLIPLVIAALLWLRNGTGWILATAYSITHVLLAILNLWLSISWLDEVQSEFSDGLMDVLNDVFYSHPLVYILVVAVFSTVVWLMSKSDIRERFKVDYNSIIISVSIAIFFAFINGINFM